MNQFWMVWNPANNQPRYRHTTEADATTEAERLAREHPGDVFVVLEAVAARKCDNMLRANLRQGEFNDEIPF